MQFIIKGKRHKRKEQFTILKCNHCGAEEVHANPRIADGKIGLKCSCGGRWRKIK